FCGRWPSGAGAPARAFAIPLGRDLSKFRLSLPQQAITNFRHPLQVALAFFRLLLNLELLDFLFQLPRARYEILFLFPLCLERIRLLANFDESFINGPQAVA